MKFLTLVLLLLFLAVPASTQIKEKQQHTFSATTTWAEKTMTGTQFNPFTGFLYVNDSSTLTDTVWVGWRRSGVPGVIDTSTTYRTPVKGGESFSMTNAQLYGVWFLASSGTIPGRLTLWR